MRWMLAAVGALVLAGCFGDLEPEVAGLDAIDDCRFAPAAEHVLYFGPGLRLQSTVPPGGFAAGNSFSSGFLTNDLKEWLSDPVADGLWLVGNVTLEYWVRSTGTPAPLLVGEPGTGYHFFNQFGSDRSFQPASAVEFSDAAPMAGQVDHYSEALEMPRGGFVVERGDRVRVLLTDLALDNPAGGGGGHDVLFGGETPSQVRFTAKCWKDVRWSEVESSQTSISLPGNQGLLFPGVVPGQVPLPDDWNQNAANRQETAFTIPDGVERVSIRLEQVQDLNPVKDDVDMELLDTASQPAWSIGSPYSDEAGALWLDNLREYFPGQFFTVRVNSYSGVAYTGILTVTFESARA